MVGIKMLPRIRYGRDVCIAPKEEANTSNTRVEIQDRVTTGNVVL